MESSSEIVAILGAVAVLLTPSYAVYWVSEIRSALAVRLYRNQALGVGLVAASVSIASLYGTGFYFYGGPPEIGFALVQLATVTLYYWTDASVRAARRVDPLLRDTFHWSRLRLLLSALIIVALIYVWASVTYDVLNGYTVGATPTGVVLTILVYVPVSVPLIAAAAVLPIVGLRSKDPVLRRHLLWFGLFAVSLGVITVGLGSQLANPLWALLAEDLGVVVGGYCLYRSARSLVPLNKLAPSGQG